MRRLLCALLLVSVSTAGNPVLATEKPSGDKAKVPSQPRQPNLRLVQSPETSQPKAVFAGGVIALRPPDLILEKQNCTWAMSSPNMYYWKCWYAVKNVGESLAAASTLRRNGSGPGTCSQGQTDMNVPKLAAGSGWILQLDVKPPCAKKVTLDALNAVWESNEKNNVYSID